MAEVRFEELAEALREIGDEPAASGLAFAIKAAAPTRTAELAEVVRLATAPAERLRSFAPRDGNLASLARVY